MITMMQYQLFYRGEGRGVAVAGVAVFIAVGV